MACEFLFIGTGASMGVPVIGCSCSVCRSKDLCNNRLRSSALLTVQGKKILIDVGPDYRLQALQHRITDLDGVILTHAHYDHTAGVDELRAYTLGEVRLPILLSQETADEMQARYPYIFSSKSDQKFTAKISTQILEEASGETDFLGLAFHYFSYSQMGMKVTGIRCGNMAYVSDIRKYSDAIFDELQGLDVLVISALRHVPTKMHFSVDEAVDFSRRAGAKQTYLTHISHELDHRQTNACLPPNIRLGYDGMSFNF